jgi:hypothetical protein
MPPENQNEGTEMFNHGSTTAESTQTTNEVKEKAPELKAEQAPIYLGGKKFNSVEELAEYTQQLEASKFTQPVHHVQQQTTTEKPLSELLFEDPEKALQVHEQRVIQKLKAEEDQRNNERKFWVSFYNENKDLHEYQDIVQFAMNKHWDELSKLHPDQAQKKIADYTRKTILKFKGGQETTKELPSGVAKAGPSTTQSAPAVTESRPAAVDFVSQVRKIQGKRR